MAKKGIRFVDIKDKLNHKTDSKKNIKTNKNIILNTINKTKDMFGYNLKAWELISNKIEKVLGFYQYEQIETPIVEYAELVLGGLLKNEADNKKQFFLVEKTGEKSMILRPELLSGMIRSYFENKMQNKIQPVKMYSLGKVFWDKPENVFSQYCQLGLESIGDSSPIIEVETMLAIKRLLEYFGLEHISFEINNLGCDICQETYIKEIKKFFKEKKTKLCSKCKKALQGNVWDIFNCEEEKCKALRSGLEAFDDFWCSNCKKHFSTIVDYLDFLKIPYEVNTQLRGISKFEDKFIFKVHYMEKDKKHSAGFGFRHDNLMKTISVNGRYGVGASIDVGVLSKALRNHKNKKDLDSFSVFLVQIGDIAKKKAFELIEELRKENIIVKTNLSKDSLRSQITMAEKSKVDCILVVGQEEVMRGEVIIRDFQSGLQESVSFAKLIPNLVKRKKQVN
jgi:histidyl-tRNA synthetase